MTWGGLNPALTSWREGINARFPRRGTASDGGYADAAHGSTSQHQEDPDGTVDAFDMDVNLLGSSNQAGTSEERALVEALKLDFEQDGSRAQLWIHQREIANRDIGDWSERHYSGDNAHDHHVHWQSRQAGERSSAPWKFTHTDALLRIMNGDDMDEKSIVAALLAADEITNLYPDAETNPKVTVKTALRAALAADVRATRIEAGVKALDAKLDVVLSALQGDPAARR